MGRLDEYATPSLPCEALKRHFTSGGKQFEFTVGKNPHWVQENLSKEMDRLLVTRIFARLKVLQGREDRAFHFAYKSMNPSFHDNVLTLQFFGSTGVDLDLFEALFEENEDLVRNKRIPQIISSSFHPQCVVEEESRGRVFVIEILLNRGYDNVVSYYDVASDALKKVDPHGDGFRCLGFSKDAPFRVGDIYLRPDAGAVLSAVKQKVIDLDDQHEEVLKNVAQILQFVSLVYSEVSFSFAQSKTELMKIICCVKYGSSCYVPCEFASWLLQFRHKLRPNYLLNIKISVNETSDLIIEILMERVMIAAQALVEEEKSSERRKRRRIPIHSIGPDSSPFAEDDGDGVGRAKRLRPQLDSETELSSPWI